MQLAFLLYKYFPFGGMQRDFLRFAQECHQLGHRVRVYALSWDGDVPAELELCLVPVSALSNHRRNDKYIHWVQQHLVANPVDGVVGFNKMAGLDVYYAADSCYLYKAEHERGPLYRFSPRFRHFAREERAVFRADGDTEVLLISATEKQKFLHYYETPADRLHMLPPGIDPARRIRGDGAEARAEVRAQLGLNPESRILLFVGSGFIKKGLDRAVMALANLSSAARESTHLLVVGQDRKRAFRSLARRRGVATQCHFLGGRDDIPTLLASADLLIHPALDEAAGIVLLEAVVAGLPVLVTDVCGYAHHIVRAGAGVVLASPFEQGALDRALATMLTTTKLADYSSAALLYAEREDLYSMHSSGAALIEKIVRARIAAVSE